jgi:hypothetical protein
MRLYPQPPGRRFATVGHDVLLLLLLVLLAWLGLKVHDAVDRLAVLGSGVKKVGDTVPLVGGPVSDLGQEGEDSVHYLANLLGFVTFGLPALLVLWWLLPPRLAHVRRMTSASKVLRGADDPRRRRVLAERAAFSLPYGRLLQYTEDPLGDLAAERYDPLVAAALDDAGLRSPPRRSGYRPARAGRP